MFRVEKGERHQWKRKDGKERRMLRNGLIILVLVLGDEMKKNRETKLSCTFVLSKNKGDPW